MGERKNGLCEKENDRRYRERGREKVSEREYIR